MQKSPEELTKMLVDNIRNKQIETLQDKIKQEMQK